MIRDNSGDVLTTGVEALVNPVNTVGVMGAGLALQFKHAYPEMFREYASACRYGFDVGQVRVHSIDHDRYVISFPTKRHWREPSRLEWIEAGLLDLRRAVSELGIRSIEIPALGCGHGGLNGADVRKLIEGQLGDLPDVDVMLYPPQNTG